MKHKLQKLEGITCRGRSISCSDEFVNDSYTESESYSYMSPSPEASDRSRCRSIAADPINMDTSDNVNFMFQDFSTDVDDLELEMGLSANDMDFDGSNVGDNSSQRSVTSAFHLSPRHGDTRRDTSPFGNLPELEIFPSSNGADFSLDVQDLLLDTTNLSGNIIGMAPDSINGSFPMSFTTPFPSPLQQISIDPGLQDSDSSLDPFCIDIDRTEPYSPLTPDSNASLLHFAVAGGHVETLQLLLQHQQAALDVKDSEGYTPIQRAIMLGRTDMVAILLQFGRQGLNDTTQRSLPANILGTQRRGQEILA